MMRGALRDLRSGAYALRPIVGVTWAIRTLHPPRRVVVEGMRPPFTLDGVVYVTLPKIEGVEPSHAGA
jgi:hypothetical protein